MKTFKNLIQTVGLIGAIGAYNLEAKAENTKQEPNTQNITYGVRNAIQRQFKNFQLTGEFGAYFPQNSEASSQSIFNLDISIKSNPINENHFYITSDLNLILNNSNNPQLDEFDMFNQIKAGANFKNFTILSNLGHWTKGLSVDLNLTYLDQINFDSDAEKSLNIGGGLRYQLDKIFEFRFNYTNTSFYQEALLSDSEDSEILNRAIFELGLTINTTNFYAQFPFVFKANYLSMSPMIGQERIHATMFSVLFQTPKQDYDGRLTFKHPIYGTSYSLRRTDKETVLDPSQESKDPDDEDKCKSILELATISQDLTLNPTIDIQKVQTLLKCQTLVNFKVNLNQVKSLKKAIGQFQNFNLEVIIPKKIGKNLLQGRKLYEEIKQIPPVRNLDLNEKIDTFAKFLILSDESIKHLHRIPSFRLTKDEQRFISELEPQADHFFDPSKGAYIRGQEFIYGENLDQKIKTNQIAIFDSKLLSYSYMGDHNAERLNRVIQLLDFVSPNINLNVPFKNSNYQESLNIANNYQISEAVRLFTPILEKKLPIIIGHHNSIKIKGYKDPIIQGVNIQEISSHGKLKLNRLDQFSSEIKISDDLSKIIITLTMQLDTYASPPKYTITYEK